MHLKPAEASVTIAPEAPKTPESENKADKPPYPFIYSNSSTQQFFVKHNLDSTKPYTKEELAKLGYGMYNRVGDGQVPIIKMIEGKDTTNDALIIKKKKQGSSEL